MGRDAVVAAATALGINGASRFGTQQLVRVCEMLLEEYHVLYPRLRPWYREIESVLKKEKRLTTAFGWTRQFFGSSSNPKVQREATAFFGQDRTRGGKGTRVSVRVDLS